MLSFFTRFGRAPTTTSPLLPGTQVGNVTIQRAVHRGGFSWVYRAWDKNAQPVLLKECMPHSFCKRNGGAFSVISGKEDRYREAVRRFFEEARLMMQFRGRGFVKILDFFWQDDIPYMVMERERGRTLKQYLATKPKPLPEHEILTYLALFVQILDRMHQEKILHLDIHPANLFFRMDKRVALLDFGAARHQDEHFLFSKETRMVTEGYSPPEILRQGSRVGPWSDFYMLGKCLAAAGVTENSPYSDNLKIWQKRMVSDDPLRRQRSMQDFPGLEEYCY